MPSAWQSFLTRGWLSRVLPAWLHAVLCIPGRGRGARWVPGCQMPHRCGWLMVFHDVEQVIGKAVNGGCIDPFAGDDRVTEKGKVGTVDECHTVEEKELMHYGAEE